MTTRRTGIVLGVLAALVLSATGGCGASTIAKQAFHELRGAQADLMFVDQSGKDVLAKFCAVRFEPATSTLGPKLCPPKLRRAWDNEAAEEQARLVKYFPGGPPALRIESEILYFQEKGIMSHAECLARVRMHEDGTLVADAIVRSESKSFRAGDEKALAGACVQAIGKFLKKQRKPAETEEEEEDNDD